MSIININEVDSIGIEKKTGGVNLIIKDDLDWFNETEHLSILQDKLNSYLAFIETGELYLTYPKAKNRSVKITIYSKYEYPQIAIDFIKSATKLISDAGFLLDYKLLKY